MKDIFLCHTGADKEWARMLSTRLEDEHINGRAIEVFFDEWDIDYGENIIAKIDHGLKHSRYVGLVLSPNMVRADWPTAEWQSQVMADPAGKRGKILPILRHKFDPGTGEPIDLPFVLAPLKRYDFTRNRDFETELQRLVRRLANLPPARGARRRTLGTALGVLPTGQEAPDAVDEALPSNLLPVLRHPEVLYSDDTPARRKGEVWKALRGSAIPPFVLHKERLVSFVPNGSANPFRRILTSTRPRTERVADWLADGDLSRQLIGMLNAGLREHCYHLGIRATKQGRTRFYCPIFKDGVPREFRWGTTTGAAGRSRALAKMKSRPNGTQFGVHMSAFMRFINLGERFFLLIEPGWLFTVDGVTPLEGKEVGRFSTLWGGKERNAAVLRNVLMWGLLIAEGRRELAMNVGTADAPISVTLQSVPVHTKLPVGLAADAIRLDRILGGEGAGEIGRHADGDARTETTDTAPSGDAGVGDGGDHELDVVADLALLGALIPDEGSTTARVEDNDAVDGHADGVTGHTEALADEEEDDGSDESDELELPF